MTHFEGHDERYTLESILEEFGSGAAQPVQNEEETITTALPRRTIAHSFQTGSDEDVKIFSPHADAAAEKKTKKRKKAKNQPELAIDNAPPTGAVPVPTPPPPAAEDAAPRRVSRPAQPELPPDSVSVQSVMEETVSAVLAEHEDGILAEKHSAPRRMRDLWRRLRRRKKKSPPPPSEQDTEALWREVKKKTPTPPPEPEPIPAEAFHLAKRAEGRLRRALWLCALPLAAMAILAAAEAAAILPAMWTDDAVLRAGVWGGGLALCALSAVPLWQIMFRSLRKRRVPSALGTALLTAAALLSCVQTLLSGTMTHTPLCLTAALLIWCQLWGAYLHRRAQREAFRLVQLGSVPPAVVSSTVSGACRQKGVLDGFYRLWDIPDSAARWAAVAVPLLLCAATVLAFVVCLGGRGMAEFFWVWSAHLTAALPLSLSLTASLPLSRLQKRLARGGTALGGTAGARAVCARRRLIITEEDLFPPGTVSFHGYKLYGEERGRMVSFATAMARSIQSPLYDLFLQQRIYEGAEAVEATDVQFCEEGGVIGTIRGETVAMGSAYFMRRQKVSLPQDLKLKTGIFLAVDGVLGAVFAIKYKPSRNAEWALRALRRNRVRPVLAVRSVNVTPGLLKRKFGVDCRPVYPNAATRLALSGLGEQPGEIPAALLYRQGLMPLTETFIGALRLGSAIRAGTVLTYLGAAAGLWLTYYLTTVGRFAVLTPLPMACFLLLWLLPTVMLSGLTRHF